MSRNNYLDKNKIARIGTGGPALHIKAAAVDAGDGRTSLCNVALFSGHMLQAHRVFYAYKRRLSVQQLFAIHKLPDKCFQGKPHRRSVSISTIFDPAFSILYPSTYFCHPIFSLGRRRHHQIHPWQPKQLAVSATTAISPQRGTLDPTVCASASRFDSSSLQLKFPVYATCCGNVWSSSPNRGPCATAGPSLPSWLARHSAIPCLKLDSHLRCGAAPLLGAVPMCRPRCLCTNLSRNLSHLGTRLLQFVECLTHPQ